MLGLALAKANKSSGSGCFLGFCPKQFQFYPVDYLVFSLSLFLSLSLSLSFSLFLSLSLCLALSLSLCGFLTIVQRRGDLKTMPRTFRRHLKPRTFRRLRQGSGMADPDRLLARSRDRLV